MSDCILGIDYGGKRIGVAIADTRTRIATPLTTVDGRNEPTRDARAITDLGVRHGAIAFVVGLPLNMADGSDSRQTAVTRRFAGELASLSGKRVELQDERLTSFAADQVLDEAEVSGKKRKALMDRIAAQKILQTFLDSEGTKQQNPPRPT